MAIEKLPTKALVVKSALESISFISIPFTKSNDTYTLTDSLVLPSNHTLTDAEIEQIEQDRFDKYVIFMTAPVVKEVV